ncbi:hypothetical protein JOB18_035330 [Solea senegalensis]|uniref:Hematopoietic progenitor cell antigen CD34 n=1 Tax=Solea senegalensis TaxID=28829 RepID=A0AAV6SV76_SOLSE|nr:uncharacterized protein si:dkey-261h17.1 [Solea senegalensis]KAG7520729.1 hypothetical protein JOB18_035330 [Solea senegalensis]
MMAVSMWRMNGLWRRVAAVLVLCTLLLSNEVICQDDATVAPVATTAAADVDAATDPMAAVVTGSPTGGASASPGVAGAAASSTPGATQFPATVIHFLLSSTLGTTVNPTVAGAGLADNSPAIKVVVPEVACVGKEDIPESSAVKAVVKTDDCEETKSIIQKNPAGWCSSDNCNLQIFQDGKTVLVASEDSSLAILNEALQSDSLKDKLGVTKVGTSSGSSVFAGILVTGLLAALAITIGYFKCQRKPESKGVRLAEEAYPVDQENQGNTLASEAPLNPPPETQEKPSVNGESPEAAKTEPPPPNNGHSTAKTADTEL